MTAVVTPAKPRSRRPDRRRTTRRLAVVTVLALAAVLLSGCLRAQVSMGVSSDDRVAPDQLSSASLDGQCSASIEGQTLYPRKAPRSRSARVSSLASSQIPTDGVQ